MIGFFVFIGKSFLVCRNHIGVKAVNACTNIITFMPFNSIKILGLRMRAVKYEKMNEIQDAYNDYAALIELNEKMGGKQLSADDILMVYEKNASLASILKRHAEAFKYSDLAIVKGSEHPEIYRIRGEENIGNSNYLEAINDLNKALLLGLNTPQIQFNLGRAHMRIHKYKAASNYFKKVEREMQNDFDFNIVKGYFYYKLEQYESSLRHYKVALRLDPSNAMCLKNIKKVERKIRNKFKRQNTSVFY